MRLKNLSKTGFRGVTRMGEGSFKAEFMFHRKQYYLGAFRTPERAAKEIEIKRAAIGAELDERGVTA